MTVLWLILCGASVICSLFCGTQGALSAAAFSGAAQGITVTLSIAGTLCLWSGLSRVMTALGLDRATASFLRPCLKRLFPQTAKDDEALGKLCGNLTANLLGLGNAATPLGIAAVRRMKALSPTGSADDEMCLLIVLNTASVQLFPATVAALRASLGAAQPMDILPAVWISSFLSAGGGILAAKLFARRHRHG